MWEILDTNIYIYMIVHTKHICNSHHANYTHYTVSEQYPFSASSINNNGQQISKNCICDEYVINSFVYIYEVRKGT